MRDREREGNRKLEHSSYAHCIRVNLKLAEVTLGRGLRSKEEVW
jgi:hypothetical protein